MAEALTHEAGTSAIQVDDKMRVAVKSPRVFGRFERAALGWYWALRSRDLKKGKVVPVELLGKKLAMWRGADGVVRAVDAHCPHMGAHLAEGMVRGNDLRCFFHGWTFATDGTLKEIPCQEKPLDLCLKTWPVEEKYGLIWIWNGDRPAYPVFDIPELEGKETDSILGTPFEKGCHPNIVMVNAIDEQHFATVHHLPVKLCFDVQDRDRHTITFENTTEMPKRALWQRIASRFYAAALTYKMCYRSGTAGSVTVGPDFLHFHIVFALRPTSTGKTEGQTLLITNKRRGLLGLLVNPVLLFLTKLVGDYFAHGDTRVFQTIKWEFANPIAADRSIIRFVKHLERQPTVTWGTWEEEPLLQIAGRSSSSDTAAKNGAPA
jgi:phenylpropionate dioxygenase-like ring-hydroxylating dioxygenase large terminal subunit